MGQEGGSDNGEKRNAYDVLSAFRDGWRAKLTAPIKPKEESSKRVAKIEDEKESVAIEPELPPLKVKEESSKRVANIEDEKESVAIEPELPQSQPVQSQNQPVAMYEVSLDESSDECHTEQVSQKCEKAEVHEAVDPPIGEATAAAPFDKSLPESASEDERSVAKNMEKSPCSRRSDRSRSKQTDEQKFELKPRIMLVGRRSVGLKNALTLDRRSKSASPSQDNRSPVGEDSALESGGEQHSCSATQVKSQERSHASSSAEGESAKIEAQKTIRRRVRRRRKQDKEGKANKSKKKKKKKKRHETEEAASANNASSESERTHKKANDETASDCDASSEKVRKKKTRAEPAPSRSVSETAKSLQDSEQIEEQSEEVECPNNNESQNDDSGVCSERHESHSPNRGSNGKRCKGSGDNSLRSRSQSSRSEVLRRALKRKRRVLKRETSASSRSPSKPKSIPKEKKVKRDKKNAREPSKHRKRKDSTVSFKPRRGNMESAVDVCRAKALHAFGLALKKQAAEAKSARTKSPDSDEEVVLKRRAALRAFQK